MSEQHTPSSHPQILLVAILSALFSFGLLFLRISYTKSESFSFLVWNLMLAAIPICLSTMLTRTSFLQRSWLTLLGTLAAWVLFFPNAPYIMTDLIHLQHSPSALIWFDVILILSFASCGLLLGFLSLVDLEMLLRRRLGTLAGNTFALASLISAAFGIYLGRFLRWNSWDLMTNPRALLGDIATLLLNPLAHPKALAITMFFSILLSLWYLAFRTITANRETLTRALSASTLDS